MSEGPQSSSRKTPAHVVLRPFVVHGGGPRRPLTPSRSMAATARVSRPFFAPPARAATIPAVERSTPASAAAIEPESQTDQSAAVGPDPATERARVTAAEEPHVHAAFPSIEEFLFAEPTADESDSAAPSSLMQGAEPETSRAPSAVSDDDQDFWSDEAWSSAATPASGTAVLAQPDLVAALGWSAGATAIGSDSRTHAPALTPILTAEYAAAAALEALARKVRVGELSLSGYVPGMSDEAALAATLAALLGLRR
jgi:hypothetical protein